MTTKDIPPVLKRRACDECRTRKLACSKESDGCSRCVRENIRCHYSEQKPMGRPRKRQREEGAQTENLYPTPPGEALRPADYPDDTEVSFPIQPSERLGVPLSTEQEKSGVTVLGDNRAIWHFGAEGIAQEIDFGFDEPAAPGQLETWTRPILLPAEVFTENANTPPPGTPSGPPCSCLASMYLAMAALQEFPVDVATALATVRSAANTAQIVIRCPKCGTIPVTDNTTECLIGGFQNTMLLGTILPIIINGYKRLLNMVDAETTQAIVTGTTKSFRLSEYGGLHGGDGATCSRSISFDRLEIAPSEWRSLVRALLRVDLYGHEVGTLGLSLCSNGLKGIIAEMELRQRTRHEKMDELWRAGVWDPEGHMRDAGLGPPHGAYDHENKSIPINEKNVSQNIEAAVSIGRDANM